MSKFKALIGDMFSSEAQTIVNTVNCVGVMGKGVALKFKENFPDMYQDYSLRCQLKKVQLGEPYLYEDLSGLKILNFPTKGHWRSSSRISDIEKGLDYFVNNYEKWGVTSIAMPPLGCGNGGLNWSDVGPLIYQKLHKLPIDIEVYAPYGTPESELKTKFLEKPTQMSFDDAGHRHEKMNRGWIAIIEVLKKIEEQPYTPPVGRTIFQKICYVLTELGIPTGFEFGKGSYGPFSADVKPALHDFANRNWIQEIPVGRMVRLKVGDQFNKERKKFITEIEEYQSKINKTVDLFSRIKDTNQAEEVLTVLYASRQLKNGDKTITITEQSIYDYIIDWKKPWNTPEKKNAVANAIRNLTLLGWIRVELSESLSEQVDCI